MIILGRWAAAGLPPSEFWAATPREIAAVLAGVDQAMAARLREQQQLVYSQAILNGYAWHQPNKMPKFDKAFGAGPGAERKKRQTPQQMFAIMEQWVAAMSANARRGKKDM